MTRSEINAGVCGFSTTVQAVGDDNNPYTVRVKIESECPAVMKLAEALGEEVDAFREISFRGGPRVLELGPKNLSHPACPVPAGIIKAIEVEAGLALPKDVSITVIKD
jgi:hypothetical protein